MLETRAVVPGQAARENGAAWVGKFFRQIWQRPMTILIFPAVAAVRAGSARFLYVGKPIRHPFFALRKRVELTTRRMPLFTCGSSWLETSLERRAVRPGSPRAHPGRALRHRDYLRTAVVADWRMRRYIQDD